MRTSYAKQIAVGRTVLEEGRLFYSFLSFFVSVFGCYRQFFTKSEERETKGELVFDREGNWVMSKTDCDRNVPAVVSEAVARELPGARIDDCDYIETPAGSYWLVETERPERDLRVTADGQVDFLP